MERYLQAAHHDLITPDGMITRLERTGHGQARAEIYIDHISPIFVGFDIDQELLQFNLKSTLAQIGLEGIGTAIQLDRQRGTAVVEVDLIAIGEIAAVMLDLLKPGCRVGKLFAADDRRRVRNPYYLSRMFGRSDRNGKPLLSLGGMEGSNDLVLDKVDGRTVAYLALRHGRVLYEQSVLGFLPTLAQGLVADEPMRQLLRLHQEWHPHMPKAAQPGEILLVRTLPLHIRTVFGRVVQELLGSGYRHTSASVLQPDTDASGDIYELYGEGKREITDIPLEFYTLEPYREHVFFEDRDQLQTCIEEEKCVFDAMETAPAPLEKRAAVFVVKGTQLLDLSPYDWIAREPHQQDFPGLDSPLRQALMVQRYIEQQPSYPLLQAVEEGKITSQGILLSRYFPSPLMKRYLLSTNVQKALKGIYFKYPSQSNQNFFSHEDRALLNDLFKFGIHVFWVDESTGRILQYTQKPETDAGMFVPQQEVQRFLNSTVFGVYGSNLMEGDFERELQKLLGGVKQMKGECDHEFFSADIPLALVTGGGPGAMAVGNRVAESLGILSCANVVDFRAKDGTFVNEQLANPHVQAKMTYRLDRLVERQAEFHLDFPIFLMGGIGTDFELALEEVRRKVGSIAPTPMLLFGKADYWRAKITHRFQLNRKTGTIKGSEWLSNCMYVVENAEQAIEVYRQYAQGELVTGPDGPIFDEGFKVIDSPARR